MPTDPAIKAALVVARAAWQFPCSIRPRPDPQESLMAVCDTCGKVKPGYASSALQIPWDICPSRVAQLWRAAQEARDGE